MPSHPDSPPRAPAQASLKPSSRPVPQPQPSSSPHQPRIRDTSLARHPSSSPTKISSTATATYQPMDTHAFATRSQPTIRTIARNQPGLVGKFAASVRTVNLLKSVFLVPTAMVRALAWTRLTLRFVLMARVRRGCSSVPMVLLLEDCRCLRSGRGFIGYF